jgi:hypothetical protein
MRYKLVLAAWVKFSSASFADKDLKAFDGNFPNLRFKTTNGVCQIKHFVRSAV